MTTNIHYPSRSFNCPPLDSYDSPFLSDSETSPHCLEHVETLKDPATFPIISAICLCTFLYLHFKHHRTVSVYYNHAGPSSEAEAIPLPVSIAPQLHRL